MHFCGGCGRPILLNKNNEWEAYPESHVKYGEPRSHEDYDGYVYPHFPGYGAAKYWYGLEAARDEYLASIGLGTN